ncbi:MAG: quinoprotein dehydrogenase-associated putative ABC transporter substrate-binding protein [Sphingomonadaceae bacterium]
MGRDGDAVRRLAIVLFVMLGACANRPDPLLVCADPNNLPFSDKQGEGFENRIVELIAHDLRRPVRYVWWAQRRGYVRNTLGKQKCDVWAGVASGLEMTATTRPYYRSTYVFVSRRDGKLAGLTLDDARLRKVTIGVQMVGDDGMNTPPAHALAVRGLRANVHGYMVYGNYALPDPAADILRSVEDGTIDVALVWGPLAGWYAKRSKVPLRIEPVTPWLDQAQWPMVYDVSMGVRKDEGKLRKRIEGILTHRKARIRTILEKYGVPLV